MDRPEQEGVVEHAGTLAAGHFWGCPFCGQSALLGRSILQAWYPVVLYGNLKKGAKMSH